MKEKRKKKTFTFEIISTFFSAQYPRGLQVPLARCEFCPICNLFCLHSTERALPFRLRCLASSFWHNNKKEKAVLFQFISHIDSAAADFLEWWIGTTQSFFLSPPTSTNVCALRGAWLNSSTKLLRNRFPMWPIWDYCSRRAMFWPQLLSSSLPVDFLLPASRTLRSEDRGFLLAFLPWPLRQTPRGPWRWKKNLWKGKRGFSSLLKALHLLSTILSIKDALCFWPGVWPPCGQSGSAEVWWKVCTAEVGPVESNVDHLNIMAKTQVIDGSAQKRQLWFLIFATPISVCGRNL